jgi:hypothetical protein
MMTVAELHRRCTMTILVLSFRACTGMHRRNGTLREKRVVPQGLPWFMKYVTGGYVSEPEAGQRLCSGY